MMSIETARETAAKGIVPKNLPTMIESSPTSIANIVSRAWTFKKKVFEKVGKTLYTRN